MSILYTGWVFVGYIVTDRYAYYFFDHKKIGWESVAAAFVAFVALEVICMNPFPCVTTVMLILVVFLFVYGLTGIREKCTKKSENKSYTRLPQ